MTSDIQISECDLTVKCEPNIFSGEKWRRLSYAECKINIRGWFLFEIFKMFKQQKGK